MKKIIVLFLMIYMGVLSFSEVDDKLGILKEEEKVKLEEKLEKISKETDLNIYMNYFTEEDTTQLKEVEKSVIINFLKEENGNLKVSINLTQDVNIEEYRGDIENTLDNLEPFLKEEEYSKYSLELLGSLEEVLLKSKVKEIQEQKEFEDQGSNKSKIFILLVFLGGLLYLRKKRSK